MRNNPAVRTSIRLAGRTRILEALAATVGAAAAVLSMLGMWPLAGAMIGLLLAVALLVLLNHRRHSGALWRMLIQREQVALQAVDAVKRDVLALSERTVGLREQLDQQNEALRDVRSGLASLGQRLEALSEELPTQHSDVLRTVDTVTADTVAIRRQLESELRYNGDERRKQNEFRRRSLELIGRHPQQVEALMQLYADHRPQAIMPPFDQWPPSPTHVLETCSLVQRHAPEFVLELGAGVSTIWLGNAVSRMAGGRVVSLEHRWDRVRWVREMVDLHGLSTLCEVRHASLTAVSASDERYEWYDPTALTDLKDIDFVVVNGPIGDGASDGRLPSLSMLMDRLADGALIVVSNACRPGQQAVANHWLRENPGLSVLTGASGDVAVLRNGTVQIGPTPAPSGTSRAGEAGNQDTDQESQRGF